MYCIMFSLFSLIFFPFLFSFLPFCFTLPVSIFLLCLLFLFSIYLFHSFYFFIQSALSLFFPFFLLFLSLFIFYTISTFHSLFYSFCCCVSGNRCTHKLDPKQRTDPNALLSHLSPEQQADILKTGATLPRLRSGTLEEKAASKLMKLVSELAAYIQPSLPLTPFQWVKELSGK